ncbi:MAG: hypothetical protein IK080_07415 [Clostridia bacterium]|nr:hypothetical protein [Clostridia bacterium]
MTEWNERAMQESLKRYLQNTDDSPERAEKYIHFYQLAAQNGVVPFRYARIAEEYTDDYFADTGVPQAEKAWYYERGIPTFKTGWYGLTKENYNDYISDFDFYSPKNYSKNSLLIKWFDYKLTTYYVLSAFRAYMPRHYFFIENGALIPMDAGLQRYGTADDVLSILRDGPIVLKSCVGGHGKGFFKVEAADGAYRINHEKTDENGVKALLSSLDNYILTEYAVPHKVFRDACGAERFAVLRTVSVFDKTDGPQITAMMLRLGTAATGLVSDYDGCINCGVDLSTGRLFNPLVRYGDAEGIILRRDAKRHPDTGVDLESLTMPDFEALNDMVKKIAAHLAMAPYLVMDIIPTDTGFRILEINSHGQVRNLEPFFPFRKNKYNLRVFETRDW